MSYAYHHDEDFVCPWCTLKTCEDCGDQYTPEGAAPPFLDDGSVRATFGFRAGGHRKCEDCWAALAAAPLAPVGAPALGPPAGVTQTEAERLATARNKANIARIKRAFPTHCAYHLYHFHLRGVQSRKCPHAVDGSCRSGQHDEPPGLRDLELQGM
jgi:hypothetical protein